jgi:hypothetical protein
MKERFGDACFWVLSLMGIMFSGGMFFNMISQKEVLLSLAAFLLFLLFFGLGWVIRYILTGRIDVRLSPTNTSQPRM